MNAPPGNKNPSFHRDSEVRMIKSKQYLPSIPVNKSMGKDVLEQELVEAFVQGGGVQRSAGKGRKGKEGRVGGEDGFTRVAMPYGEESVTNEGIEAGKTGKRHFKAKKGKTRDYWTKDYNY